VASLPAWRRDRPEGVTASRTPATAQTSTANDGRSPAPAEYNGIEREALQARIEPIRARRGVCESPLCPPTLPRSALSPQCLGRHPAGLPPITEGDYPVTEDHSANAMGTTQCVCLRW
jgi:hypothetical protein